MIDGVEIFTPDVHTDYRGDLWTIWKRDEFPKDLDFNHDKISTSRKNVIRGIHGDFKSWKLCTCLYGEIYVVIVDNRKDSKTTLDSYFQINLNRSKQLILVFPVILVEKSYLCHHFLEAVLRPDEDCTG